MMFYQIMKQMTKFSKQQLTNLFYLFRTKIQFYQMNLNQKEIQESTLAQSFAEDPFMSCQASSPIQRLCINPACSKLSLICSNVGCAQCGNQSHQLCPNIRLDGISRILNSFADKHQTFINRLCQLQSHYLLQLYANSESLKKRQYKVNLEQQYIQTLSKIYEEKDRKCLKGKQAYELYQRIKMLQSTEDSANKQADILLQHYQQTMRRIIDSMIALKESLYDSFIHKTSRVCQFKLDSKVLQEAVSPNYQQFKDYRSVLIKHWSTLKDQLVHEQVLYLKDVLNQPKKIQLLYRGSEHNFSAQAFHKKCDGIENTLLLVRTQFGRTIGGFTKYPWGSPDEMHAVADDQKQAFLLSLDFKQKMIPKDGKDLIWCDKDRGPLFSGFRDLCISDQCDKGNSNTYANFPNHYNYEGQNKYVNSQQSYRAFSGAIQGNRFRVIQYEVFKVLYE